MSSDSALFLIYFTAFLCTAFILWVMYTAKHKKAMNMAKEFWGPDLQKQYSFEKDNAIVAPEKKYKVDMASINQFMNLGRQLAQGNIARGYQMQREEGPQKDWAVAGGIASGLAGGAAGAAVAMKTMQDNAESTRRHHETGRQMVQNGQESLRQLDQSMSAIRYAVNHRKDHFNYTEPMPELLESFESGNSTVSVPGSKKITQTWFKMNMSQEKVNLNAVELYNEIGYFKANINIVNNRAEKGTDNKRYRIDGGFRVDLYDGEEKFADGYVTDGTWSVDTHKNIGFKSSVDKEITFKLCYGKKLIPDKAYSMRFEEPNLWLVEM